MSPIFQSTADLEIFKEIAFFMVNGHKVDVRLSRLSLSMEI